MMARNLDKMLNRALLAIAVSALLVVVVRRSSDTSAFDRAMMRLLREDIRLPKHWLDFRYNVSSSDLCQVYNKDVPISGVIIITSHVGNLERRNAMRKAWPASSLRTIGLRRIFLLALPNLDNAKDGYNHKVTRAEVVAEEAEHQDIVQFEFQESFRRLTYKNLMGFKWAVDHCAKSKWIVKMDDSITLHAVKLSNFLNSLTEITHDGIVGILRNNTLPVRDMESRWFIRRDEFDQYYYPPYVTGWLYMMQPKVASQLLEASKNVPFFWVDDVYITGMLAKWAGIKHVNKEPEIMKLG